MVAARPSMRVTPNCCIDYNVFLQVLRVTTHCCICHNCQGVAARVEGCNTLLNSHTHQTALHLTGIPYWGQPFLGIVSTVRSMVIGSEHCRTVEMASITT